jgi:FKBP-type peptidyl-prolyl cis-trans isomerase
MRFRLLAILLCAAVAACGNSTTAPAAAVPIEQTTFAPSLGVDLAQSTKLWPSGMYYRDLIVGSGATVSAGQTVPVYYVGAFANGQIFDSRSAPATPFSAELVAGQLIQGWIEGLPGMKLGGRRQLIIPPELGYGPNDYLDIPGNSVLVFVVDAISAQ